MRTFLLGLLGALALAGLALPPLAAVVARSRLAGTEETDETSDEINLVAIFEGVDVANSAAAFRGGSVLAWYGGGDLDLRDATLDPAGARLRARSIFGGLRILVPASWPVEVHSVGLFGGVGNRTDPATADPAAFESLQVALAARLADGELTLDPVSGRLDDTNFEGQAVPGRKSIRAALDRIDLNRYLPPAAKTASEKKRTLEEIVAGLAELDLDAEIRVGEVKIAGATMRDAVIRVEPDGTHTP